MTSPTKTITPNASVVSAPIAIPPRPKTRTIHQKIAYDILTRKTTQPKGSVDAPPGKIKTGHRLTDEELMAIKHKFCKKENK